MTYAPKGLVLTPNVFGGGTPYLLHNPAKKTVVATGGLTLPIPQFEEQFADGPSSEGGQRTKSKPQNPSGRVATLIMADDDDTFWARVREWENALFSARDRPGATLDFTPENGAQVSYDLETVHITSFPADAMYIANRVAVAEFEFTCLPFARLPTQTNVTLSDIDPFNRDTITNQEWRFDAGAGKLTVGGGVLSLVDTSTTPSIYRPINIVDSTSTIKINTGANVSGGNEAIRLKRLSATSYLRVKLNIAGAASNLTIEKENAGGTVLATSANFTVVAANSYWLQGKIAGNVITAKLFTQDPNAVANPTQLGATLTYTLLAGDATAWGAGVKGNPGLIFNPFAIDTTVDDWRVDSTTMEGFDPVLNFEVFGIPGTEMALGKLKVAEISNQARSHLEIGVDDKYYLPTNPQPITLDSDSLVTTGAIGVQAVGLAIAPYGFPYDPGATGNNVITATLSPAVATVCSTGTLGHVGPQRIKMRSYGLTAYARLAWRVGDGLWEKLPWVKVGKANAYAEFDLGVIQIPEVLLGTQGWEGRIEAYTDDTSGNTGIAVDYLEILPAVKFSKARVAAKFNIGNLSIQDGMNQAAGALAGKNLARPSAQTWTGVGDPTDFTLDGAGLASRAEINDASPDVGRYAIAGTNVFGSTGASIDFMQGTVTYAPNSDDVKSGVIVRYTDVNNWVMAFADRNQVNGNTGSLASIVVRKRLAGVGTNLLQFPILTYVSGATLAGSYDNKWWTLGMTVDTLGNYIVYFGGQGSVLVPIIAGNDANFASGTLSTGKVGFYDEHANASVSTRYYDNMVGGTPDTISPVITALGTTELRHNAMVRSTARIPSEGDYLKLRPAGRELRATQFAIKARRNDVDLLADDQISDAVSVSLDVTPRVTLV